MSTIILAQLDTLTLLAAELRALASELEDQTRSCSTQAASLFTALPGEEGLTAGAAASTWAALLAVLADRTAVVSAVLVAAVEAYRAEDAALAGRIPVPRRGPVGADW